MQSTKVNSKNNYWEEMIIADSQGSVLDPLLFNIFLCDLFLIMENCNLCRWQNAMHHRKFKRRSNLKIRKSRKTHFQWFSDNEMKANPDKCHFFVAETVKLVWPLKTKNKQTRKLEKLRSIKLESKLNFNSECRN